MLGCVCLKYLVSACIPGVKACVQLNAMAVLSMGGYGRRARAGDDILCRQSWRSWILQKRGGWYLACRYEDAGEAGDDDFMQAELDKLDQMGLTDHGRVD